MWGGHSCPPPLTLGLLKATPANVSARHHMFGTTERPFTPPADRTTPETPETQPPDGCTAPSLPHSAPRKSSEFPGNKTVDHSRSHSSPAECQESFLQPS